MPAKYDFRWDKQEHIRQCARALGEEHSLFFTQKPWVPAIDNMEGAVSYYDPVRIDRVRRRLKGLDKKRYLKEILDEILEAGMGERERVAAICGFVSGALYFNPLQQPQEDDTEALVMDPVELLELHDARCGQGVAVTLALLDQAGIEGRKRDVVHHTLCEARYEGQWRLADALMFGKDQPERDGEVVSVADLQREPYFADAFPLRCFTYKTEEVLSADGFRYLGYCFGEWGSLPYYSSYMGGEEEFPPMMPTVLAPERVARDMVRLRWSPSGRRKRGRIRYRIVAYRDRARTRPIFKKTTTTTTHAWPIPELDNMYFFGVTAIDDHIEKNPDTWYPESVANFVLPSDEGQYGWYGLL